MRNRYKYLLALLGFCLFHTTIFAVEISTTTEKETNLIAWKITDENFQLDLVQRSPQQTRSFFQGRGFKPHIANDIATHCVFQTIVKNTQEFNQTDSIKVSLKHWKLTKDKELKSQPLKLKKQWDDQWKKDDVNVASRIAFRWATFPTEQTFEPGGDFNWGMITFGLKPDTVFDLHIVWEQGDSKRDAWIKQLKCPTDTL